MKIKEKKDPLKGLKFLETLDDYKKAHHEAWERSYKLEQENKEKDKEIEKLTKKLMLENKLVDAVREIAREEAGKLIRRIPDPMQKF